MSLSRRRARIVGRLRHRKTREREGLFLVEGVRAGREALEHGAAVRFAVASPRLRELGDGQELLAALDEHGVEPDWVEDAVLAGLADTETPQGLLLACEQPSHPVSALLEGEAPRLLLVDGVQDPGNMGTLVRAATAFGLDGVVAMEGTVDPWNPKAVRASAGTLFQTRVAGASWEEVGPLLEGAGVEVLVSDAEGEDVASLEPPGGWALVIGSEGHGVRPAIRSSASRTAAVPMTGPAESLNAGVAGAILMYALTRSVEGP